DQLKALAITYDLESVKSFEDIEKEILLHSLSEQWKKVKLGHICYQISNITKADHYDLKSAELL
ncbi:6697_t:CDS:2, partial [Cetraspora pellucida]